MPQNVEPLENLVDQFARFPGIGRKGATRMAYEVMSMSNEQAMELAKAIEHAKKDLHRCRICQDYTADEICKICASPKRDRSVICVVESPRDIKSIERTHEYNGLYHVLHGLISPMDGIGADQLCVKELALNDTVKEVGWHQPHGGRRSNSHVSGQADQAAGNTHHPAGLWPAEYG